MSRDVTDSRHKERRLDVDLDGRSSTAHQQIQIEFIRRYATIVALLAAVAQVLLLALGVDNWRVSLALALPVLAGIVCGASKNDQAGRAYQNSLQTGLAGGAALVGIGLHSNSGVVLAVLSLLFLAWFPTPRLHHLAVAFAALSPWVAEAIAGAQGEGSMLLGILVISVIALIWVRSKELEVLVVALGVAATVYVASAILLYLLGVQASYSEGYLTQALTSFGPFDFRWRLPLSVSWVTVPTVATLGTVLCVWVLRIDRRLIAPGAGIIRLICAGGIFLNLVAILAANGRTHLIAAVVGAVVASGVVPRVARNVLVFVSSALWLAPLWWDRVAGASDSIIATILVNYLPNRGSASRTATLQGRTIIWDISLENFGDKPLTQQVPGWGPDGYIASGAATQYSSVLGGVYRSGYYPPHNAMLEVLLSGGLALAVIVSAGIVLLLCMQTSVLRHGTEPTTAGIAALAITLAAVAFSEVAVLPSNASPAGLAVPLVTMITLVAYSQSKVSRERRGRAGSTFVSGAR